MSTRPAAPITQFGEAFGLLHDGVRSRLFSGAVAGVSVRGLRSLSAAGAVHFSRDAAPVVENTLFDLASLTKCLATSTIAARLVARGELDLDSRLVEAFEDVSWHEGFSNVTLCDLLAHRAGLASWWDLRKLSCLDGRSGALVEELRRTVLAEIGRCAPENPPRKVTLYGDLAFILAGEWLSRTAKRPLWDIFDTQVRAPLGCRSFICDPLDHGIQLSLVAAGQEKEERGGLVWGRVDDDNALLLGGFAGHAGLFGNARDCLCVAEAWLDAYLGKGDYLPKSVVRKFLRKHPAASGQPMALGWDVPAGRLSGAGASVSSRAVGHLGFTGTSLWIDLTRRTVVVLLTNRVHAGTSKEAIRDFRRRFHDAVWKEVDA